MNTSTSLRSVLAGVLLATILEASAIDFCGTAICDDGFTIRAVPITIQDDDSAFNDVGDGATEPGADPRGTIDGVDFAPNADHPSVDMDIVTIDITDGLGTLNGKLAIRYTISGVSYYLPRSTEGVDFPTVSGATFQSVALTTVTNISYAVYSIYEKLPAPSPDPSMDEFCGKALCVNRNGTVTAAVDVRVWDDDSSFNDVGDGAGEGGALDPVGTIDGLPFVPNADHPQVDMDIVTINITDGLGTLNSKLAIRYFVNGVSYYLPRSTEGVDFATATSATLQSVTGTTVTNISYHVYNIYEKLPAPSPDPSMDEFCGKALCVNRNGTVTAAVDVRVWDDDSSFNDVGDGAGEGGALDPVGTIDGLPFVPNADHPQVDMDIVTINITDGLGTLNSKLAIRYFVNGVSYYLPRSTDGIDFATATSATFQSVASTTITNISYHVYSIYEKLPAPSPDPSMDEFCGKALCVNRNGTVTAAVDVRVWDDDSSFNDVGDGAGEGGALDPVGTIDGLPFVPNADHPQVDMDIVTINITDGLGTLNGRLAIRYFVNGVSYYLPRSTDGIDFATATSATFQSVASTTITNIFYPAYGLYEKLPAPSPDPSMDEFCGKALCVNRNGTVTAAVDVLVWDDDSSFNDVGDGAGEGGALDPVGTIGGLPFVPNADHPQVDMDIVTINITDGLGTLNSKLAIRYFVNGVYYYLPRSTEGVDFATATSATLQSVASTTITNISYHVYGIYYVSSLGMNGARENSQVLEVARTGAFRVAEFDIWDDDPFFSNLGDGDSEQGLDPYGLVNRSLCFSPNASDPGTVIRAVEMNVVIGGSATNVRAMEYVVGGFIYYLPLPDGAWSPGGVTAINSVTAVNDPPVITSGGSASVPENIPVSQVVYTATATDFEGEAPVFSITGGSDQAFFAIDAASGALTFLNSPDFENPQDGNSNNIYRVVIGASDGQDTVTRLVLVTVTDRTGLDTFGDWIEACFPGVTDPAIVGLTADLDQDGTTNLFEFLYEGDPKSAANPGAPPIESVRIMTGSEILAIDATAAVSPAESYCVIRMREPKNLREWRILLSGSPGLNPFGGGIVKRFGPSIDDGAFWLRDHYQFPPVDLDGAGFARVEIELP